MERFCFNEHYLTCLRTRDASTLSHFYDYFRTPIRAKLRSHFPWDLAEDLSQDVFVAALERIDQGEPSEPGKLPGYIAGICRNVIYRTLQDKAHNQTTDIDCFDCPDSRPSAETRMVNQSEIKQVQKILRGLRRRDREVLVRIIYYGQDRRQIARQLGVTQDHLRLVLQRALHRFRDKWEDRQGGAAHP
ncbi:MAG: sigma-70 family RNA polymerase sigma factor [Acidobacteriaceae bacterium]|nr:sigma-70 family RNA polymerase sigma factor [Acidobacteriaceae bacterium]